jgi:hypothetical protein
MGHPLAALPSNVENITASEVFDIPAMGARPDSASAGRYLARQTPAYLIHTASKPQNN